MQIIQWTRCLQEHGDHKIQHMNFNFQFSVLEQSIFPYKLYIFSKPGLINNLWPHRVVIYTLAFIIFKKRNSRVSKTQSSECRKDAPNHSARAMTLLPFIYFYIILLLHWEREFSDFQFFNFYFFLTFRNLLFPNGLLSDDCFYLLLLSI